MKVKVGDKWYSSDEQPVAVEFKDHEIEYIKNNMDKKSAPNNRFGVGVWNDYRSAKKWIRERDK